MQICTWFPADILQMKGLIYSLPSDCFILYQDQEGIFSFVSDMKIS